LLDQFPIAILIFGDFNPLFEIGIPNDNSDLVCQKTVTFEGENLSDLPPLEPNSMSLSCPFGDLREPA
jgi:hypothetical protein